MSERFVQIRIATLGLLFLAVLVVWWPAAIAAGPANEYLTVRFLDVGQGDAIHIITPDGYELLIDGGPSAVVLRQLAVDRSFFDHYIDVMVATHPDTDHVAGLVDVLERYEVGMLIETAAEHDAPAAVAYGNAARAEGARIITAQAGQVVQLGASTTVRILSPHGDATNWRSNVASVIVQVQYGEVAFMLTGDAPSSIEEYLAGAYGAGLKSQVLKLGHHGSDTSSSEVFLEAVQPQYAVVSAGKDNRYGHPKGEVLSRARGMGTEIVSTAERGTITFHSDGSTVWLIE
ncbi:MAG: MBL fold metallo-hydrolase [Candidatus Kaiserbacteria bacterium]|nr:MBL fold metallo-hydrolase [Candidatus Kaiserbacteria bacterium]MCB9816612.1 MBL fold metallo-hydrolase [Candidatus Nomurabacteria bacterium]